ncbi:MAG: DNA primase noncatalytic subunit PriX, partial [Nitrososphaeraceae archaeon]
LHHSVIQYEWIGKLLETPMEDGRKYALWKILCPYLVNIKKLEYNESFKILNTWLEKCNNLRTLDFNPDNEIKSKLSSIKHYNPISIKKLKDDNRSLSVLLKKIFSY